MRGALFARVSQTNGVAQMAEIRVAPQRRSRAMLWITLVVVLVLAALAWYFLAGPGVNVIAGM